MKNLLSLAVYSCISFAQTSPVVIDGRLDEAVWRSVAAEKLAPEEAGVPSSGGEVRTVIQGRYLLIGATLPERGGRITARMTGRHPNWEDEDMLRIVAGPDIGYTDRMVRINPLGAYSVEREGQVVYANAERYLVATSVNETGWTVEFAFPLNEVSAPGPHTVRASVERLRAARPDAPRFRWRWPLQETAALIRVDPKFPWDGPKPQFQPAAFRPEDPPLQVGRSAIPPLETGWNQEPWRGVPVWRLLRHEPSARMPRLASEVKALHDGRTLSLFARLVETETPVSDVRENDGRLDLDDSFQVYLAASGSSYVQLAANAAGYFLDLAGKTGGPRISRPRADWDSGTKVTVTRETGAWLVRFDVPIGRVAAILGEPEGLREFRMLLMRNRVSRAGDPRESSVLPVVLGETTFNPARYGRLTLMDAPAPPPASVVASSGPFDSLETDAFSPAERAERRLARMLESNLQRRVTRILEAEATEWAQVQTRAGWERFRDRRMQALREFIGEMPSRVPLDMRIGKEHRGQGYRRLDILYRSRATLWIAANLYLPDQPGQRRPALIIIPSHHRPRWQAELQDMGILWARAGAVVLVPDNLSHGERIQTYPWNREAYHSRYNLGMQLYAAGESLIKWMVWDTIRAVDLLLERPDVDAQRIVLLGAVAGGGDPAAVSAALDRRISGVVPFNFGEATPRTSGRGRWPPNLADPGWGSWESTRNLPSSISGQFFPWLICASVAPRRFSYSYEMGWDVEQQPAWRRYQKVFGFYDARDHLDEAHGFGGFPGPGECSNIGPSQRKTLYPELQRWFGISIPAAEPDDRRPEAELTALTPQLASQLKMQLAHEVAREAAQERLRSVRRTLASLSASARVQWLRENWRQRLGEIDPGPPPAAAVKWSKQLPLAAVEAITLDFPDGIAVPLLLLRPAQSATPPPVVVAVSQGGKGRVLRDHASGIEALLRAGIAVCLPDVRGTGETAPDTRRGPQGAEITLAATELMMGNSLLGARLKDTRAVLSYLASRSDLAGRRVALWGDSYAPANPDRLILDETPGWQMGPQIQYQVEPLGGMLALLTALYEDRVQAVAIRRGLASIASLLDDRFVYVPGDVIVPGMLEAGDLPDVAAALAPRPVLLHAMRDARNRPISHASLRSMYPAAPDPGRSDEAALAEWLTGALRQP